MDATTMKPKVTPKDFFLWLGAMAALYVSAISLILLVHQYINVLFPNELEYYADYSSSIRFAIASLVVVFPVFIILMRLIHTDIRRIPEKKDLWVRRWLVFITLFIAGATIAGDLIALIYTFLNGDITTRFVLKALTILVVLGGGFWYYLEELRGRWETSEGLSKLIGGVVALVVLASIVGGFFIIGSPETQRLMRLDEQKVNDLSIIQQEVTTYWQQKQELPREISDLEDPLRGFIAPMDTQYDESYRYEVTGPMNFRLCAMFNLESSESKSRTAYTYYGTPSGNWQHEAGEVCFDRTIDPDLFPPISKPVF
jgi:hypothetical protein